MRFDIIVDGEWYMSTDTLDVLDRLDFDGFVEIIDNGIEED